MVNIDKQRKVAKQINRLLQLSTEDLSESQALEVPDLFEEWKADKEYEKDKVLKYGEVDGVTQLYKVVLKHVSLDAEDYKPDYPNSPLFKNFGLVEGGHEIWVQPLGYDDAYNTGKIVSHNGVLYESTVDNNIWEPTVYGWELYNE